MRYLFLFIFLRMLHTSLSAQYIMPAEDAAHEGTWLQWPHDHTYGTGYRDFLEASWIAMTAELVKGEKVHIIAYDDTERTHIETVLTDAGISLALIDFYIHPTDDFWVRDNGPIFVYDADNALKITDWNFDGWGNDYAFAHDDIIPQLITEDISTERIDVHAMTLEGGALETDGNGTFLGTESSILGDGRNPGFTRTDAEEYLSDYLGLQHFIWLDGVYGGTDDVTDMHIDGFAKFADTATIMTMDSLDLLYWYLSPADISALYQAQNIYGNDYNKIYLPLTKHNVKTTEGINIGYKSSYVNYYVANAVVLVPVYEDENDSLALSIIRSVYPDKEVVGIDSRNMAFFGGMVHCTTQQQPVAGTTGMYTETATAMHVSISPNPFSEYIHVQFMLADYGNAAMQLFDITGKLVETVAFGNLPPGNHTENISAHSLPAGIYTFEFTVNRVVSAQGKLVKTK